MGFGRTAVTVQLSLHAELQQSIAGSAVNVPTTASDHSAWSVVHTWVHDHKATLYSTIKLALQSDMEACIWTLRLCNMPRMDKQCEAPTFQGRLRTQLLVHSTMRESAACRQHAKELGTVGECGDEVPQDAPWRHMGIVKLHPTPSKWYMCLQLCVCR
jgi:hypothetical protein